MLYFVYLAYEPNTAPTNRSLAFFRSIDKLGVPIKVKYLLPDVARSRLNIVFKNVEIEYCWDHFFINNRYLKYISYVFYLFRLAYQLKKGDKVYIYALNDIIRRIVEKKGVDFFYEITECPEVSLSTTELCKPTINKHLEFCKKVKGLLVISNQLKNYYIQKGINGHKIHIINIVVDPDRFASVLKENNQERYIAYCGTASNNKDGVDILIKAFAQVSKSHPEIKLYIIGSIPTEVEKHGNIRLIEELGLQDKVVLTGPIPAAEMPQMLKNAEILALARPDNIQAKYGFPTKLGEYLLSGNPVVVTDVGDISSFLKDKESAMIVQPNNPKAFAEQIVWLLDHPSEGNAIGANGKEVALNYFNAYTETKKLLNIINS